MFRYGPKSQSAPVAQRLDRPPVTREAAGSTPAGRAKLESSSAVEQRPVKSSVGGSIPPSPAKRGRPQGGKEQVTIRLDKDVLAKFKATGDGWQGRINEALRKAAP